MSTSSLIASVDEQQSNGKEIFLASHDRFAMDSDLPVSKPHFRTFLSLL